MLPNRTVVHLILILLLHFPSSASSCSSTTAAPLTEKPWKRWRWTRTGTRVGVCVWIRDRVENGRLAPDHTHGSTV